MAGPLILFPDVEAWLIRHLDETLSARAESYAVGAVVTRNVPNPRPRRLVTITSDGGPRLDAVRQLARIRVNVWAHADEDAADLAQLVRALIVACPDGRPVVRVQNDTDPIEVPDATPRRLVTAELTVRGATA